MTEALKILITALIGVFAGLITKIGYDLLTKKGNGHSAPCEYVKELQHRVDNRERLDLEIVQRLSRIETKIDNGYHPYDKNKGTAAGLDPAGNR